MRAAGTRKDTSIARRVRLMTEDTPRHRPASPWSLRYISAASPLMAAGTRIHLSAGGQAHAQPERRQGRSGQGRAGGASGRGEDARRLWCDAGARRGRAHHPRAARRRVARPAAAHRAHLCRRVHTCEARAAGRPRCALHLRLVVARLPPPPLVAREPALFAGGGRGPPGRPLRALLAAGLSALRAGAPRSRPPWHLGELYL